LIDITTIRSLDYGNQYILRRESQTFYQAKKTNRTKLALKSLVLDCIRILSLAEIWNFPNSNDEVIVEDDLSNVNQLVVKVPAYVVPGLHNIANQINLLIR
jgi:phage tail sheath gpL-like